MHTYLHLNNVVACQTYTDILYCQPNVEYGLFNQSKLATIKNVSLRKYHFERSAIK